MFFIEKLLFKWDLRLLYFFNAFFKSLSCSFNQHLPRLQLDNLMFFIFFNAKLICKMDFRLLYVFYAFCQTISSSLYQQLPRVHVDNINTRTLSEDTP